MKGLSNAEMAGSSLRDSADSLVDAQNLADLFNDAYFKAVHASASLTNAALIARQLINKLCESGIITDNEKLTGPTKEVRS